ncbi:hypothetical protein RNJ44_04758 [Nakaseomyces bracarensis]|uniref:Glutaredoxin domain-containing protein n=1 Tax=Nakaseomyces bracarensis TaxID=273131 RepID=A0ABR4NVU2_9SACH
MSIILNKRHVRLALVTLLLIFVTYLVAFNGPSGKTQLPSSSLVNSVGDNGNIPGIHKDHVDKQENSNGVAVKADAPVMPSFNDNKGVEPKAEEEEEFIAADEYERILKTSPVIVFSKSYCSFSRRLKTLLRTSYSMDPEFFVVEVDKVKNGDKLFSYVKHLTGRKTVPNMIVNGVSRGGYDDIAALHNKDQLLGLLKEWCASTSLTVSKAGESPNKEDD